ncbi:MAG: ABC transporter permease [Candidatus Bipolaricaulota bacterium]
MKKTGPLLERLVYSFLTIVVAATLLFLLFRLVPGDPSSTIISPSMTQQARRELLQQQGLDKPLYVQYVLYLRNLFTGNLGQSFLRGKSVLTVILRTSANTLALMLTSTVLVFLAGPILGALLAWNKGTWIDSLGFIVVLTLYALPVFWTGMLAIMFFSFRLGWFPPGGMHSSAFIPQGFFHSFFSLDFLRHLALPLTVTSAYFLAIPTLTMRSNMIAVLGEDFIQMARAKGLSERTVLFKHAIRNSLLPILHYAAIEIGFAFGGAIVIETVFSWPGLGRLMWQAVQAHDYPLAQGAFLSLVVIIVTLNLVADFLSSYLDPRVMNNEF